MFEQIIEVLDNEARKKLTFSKGIIAAVIFGAFAVGTLFGVLMGKASCRPPRPPKYRRKRDNIEYECDPDFLFDVPAYPKDTNVDMEEEDDE